MENLNVIANEDGTYNISYDYINENKVKVRKTVYNVEIKISTDNLKKLIGSDKEEYPLDIEAKVKVKSDKDTILKETIIFE